MSSTEPDIVVGIDFGMTFTGVAYSNKNMPQPRVIQKWPGKLHETSRKVPSILCYQPLAGNPEWGFPCQYNEHKIEWFKRYLDPEFLERLRAAEPEAGLPSAAEVRKWYKDYMECLYIYISRFLQDQIGSWDHKRVEFLFSLPTTFRSQTISTNLRELLFGTGFGRRNHTIEFGLTEPQAAAVDAAKDSSKNFQDGDIMLVCDAGGATTDFALLEKMTSDEERPKLEEVATIPGVDVGSTNIDVAFEALVDSRLQAGNVPVVENTAWTMMHSPEFQEWKCSFGSPLNENVLKFLVPVPSLDESVSNRAAGIESGKMAFSHDDFRSFFDPQVNQIMDLVRQQFNLMTQDSAGRFVNYLILSGGLGSNPYLLTRLREEFMENTHFAAPSLEILISDEPQLAVCRGLVIDRIQRIKRGNNVLVGRICPASYGVLCDKPYDKQNPDHVGQKTYVDVITGLTYVTKQVDWMIKKGEKMDVDRHISHTFERIVCRLKDKSANSKKNRIWKSGIVISHQDAHRLPSSLSNADCHVLCNITSDLSSLSLEHFDLVKGHKSWYKRVAPRDRYRTAEYEIKAIIGPTDIKFELWYEGQPYNKPQSIQVDWQEGSAISAPNENRQQSSDILAGIRKRRAKGSGKNKTRTANSLRQGLRSPFTRWDVYEE